MVSSALSADHWVVQTKLQPPPLRQDFVSRPQLLEGALTMLTATRQHLDVECYEIVKDRPDSKFYNNFIFETLPLFSSNEIDALLERALSDHPGITF